MFPRNDKDYEIDKRIIGEEARTLAVLLRGHRVIAIEEPPDNRRMRESRKLRRRTSRSCFLETTRIGIDKRVIGEEARTLAVLLRGLRVIAIEEPPDNRRMRESRKLRRRTSRSCFLEMTRIGIDKRVIREEERTLAVLLRGPRVTAIEEPPDNRRMRESRKLRKRRIEDPGVVFPRNDKDRDRQEGNAGRRSENPGRVAARTPSDGYPGTPGPQNARRVEAPQNNSQRESSSRRENVAPRATQAPETRRAEPSGRIASPDASPDRNGSSRNRPEVIQRGVGQPSQPCALRTAVPAVKARLRTAVPAVKARLLHRPVLLGRNRLAMTPPPASLKATPVEGMAADVVEYRPGNHAKGGSQGRHLVLPLICLLRSVLSSVRMLQ